MTDEKPTGSDEKKPFSFWRMSSLGKLSSMVLFVASVYCSFGALVFASGSVSEATKLILISEASWMLYLLSIYISGRIEATREEVMRVFKLPDFGRFNGPQLVFVPLLHGITVGVLIWFLGLMFKAFFWLIKLIGN